MRWISSFIGTIAGLLIIGVAAKFLGLEDFIRRSIEAGYLLDWVMGGLSLVWLMVILKAPWDLFFQANAVAFEQQRSRERGIALTSGREGYVQTVRNRLLVFAIGAHLFSAALIASITYFTHGTVGYYFAGFYLVATLFRPVIAGYVYLAEKLRAIGQEAHYPREDVEEMRQRLIYLESEAKGIREEMTAMGEEWQRSLSSEHLERERLQTEINDQRQRLNSMSREFEATVNRLTDNQEVITGIQAFVRLIRKSAEPE